MKEKASFNMNNKTITMWEKHIKLHTNFYFGDISYDQSNIPSKEFNSFGVTQNYLQDFCYYKQQIKS